MQRLFAIVLAVLLWFGFVETAPAQAAYDNLTPCGQSQAFANRMKASESPTAARRYEQYSKAGLLCGDDGLPHLIVDNPAHAGDFIIPGLMFLYIAGWIGWAGRSYLQAIQKGTNPEAKEITIDVPMAIKFMIGGFAWPLAAFGEISTGKMFAKENEITVSPR